MKPIRWWVACCLVQISALVIGPPASALSDPGLLPDVATSPAPAGYGNYCSVTDPSNGGWALKAVTSGDSCAQLSVIVGPKSVVQRAGLWSIKRANNVMVRCDGGLLYFGRSNGQAAINWIFGKVSKADHNCTFIISPTKLPTFGLPFPLPLLITGASVFGYHLAQYSRYSGFLEPWDVSDFGHVGADACEVDRTGTMVLSCATGSVAVANPNAVPEAAYDWTIVQDMPILAVADGVIRASYARTVPCATPQEELFLETQVGQGRYAEHFVAAYHHMDANPNLNNPDIKAHVQGWGGKPMAPAGSKVKKGDVIGYIGSSGCSSTPHLDFMAFRLTNLTGARSYVFAPVPDGYTGVNGWQGVFDPFGWAAPKGVDPLAYKFIGKVNPDHAPAAITDLGVFSVNLWDPVAFTQLPHNGGPSW